MTSPIQLRVAEAQPAPSARRRLSPGATFLVVVATAATVVLVTHDVGYLLTWPLWGDEAWVVLSRLFPISDLPKLTSSAPIGWNLMVQGFAVFGDQGGRLLVQMFNVGAVVAAFYAGREAPIRPLKGSPTIAGVIGALGVALAPATLLRVDIKHYTADAFIALVILCLTIRALREPRGRAIIVMTTVCSIGLLVAFSTLFVAVAAYASLLLAAVLGRTGRIRVILNGAIAAGAMAAIYGVFYSTGDNPALRRFWEPQYPADPLHLPYFIGSRLLMVDNSTTFVTVLVIGPLAAVAIWVAARRGAWGFAVFLPVVFGVMCLLGLLHRYPLLDARTSNFFVILTSWLVAQAAWWLIDSALQALAHRTRPSVTPTSALRSASIVAIVIAVLALPSIRAHSLPGYDTTHQVDYVLTHRSPDDLVIYNELAGYQLALSWPADRPSWCPDDGAWTGYVICYKDTDRIVGFSSLPDAYELISTHLAEHPGSRVWLIRSHVFKEYERMERELPEVYKYQVIDLPIQPVGVITGTHS